MTKLTVAFFFGLMISFPIFLYQMLIFILPAFNNKLTFFKTYDAVDFNYKTGDKKYKIYSLLKVYKKMF